MSQAESSNSTHTDSALPKWRMALFSMGDISSSMPLALQMFFQLYFLTDVARLSPAAAGWVLAITRAWDAVNDPLVGLWSDRIRARWGRRRVLLVYGSVPLGVAFALSWLIPPWSDTARCVYYTCVLIAFDTAFTVVHIGYNSLTPQLTFDYDERSTLNGFRMCFSLCGTLSAVVLATLLGTSLANAALQFAVLGLIVGLIVIVPPWIVLAVTRGVDQTEDKDSLDAWTSLRAAVTNRAFAMLMAMYLASWTAASVLAAMLIYFANYYLQAPQHAHNLVLVAEGSATLCVPLVVALARRWDKPRTYLAGIIWWCGVLLTIACLQRSNLSGAYWCAAACGPGIATALVIPWSMVPDVIEDDQLQTGRRREGAFYSLVAFFQKLGTGGAIWAIGQILSACGYVTPTEVLPVPDQPPNVLAALRWIIGPATVITLAISLPIAWYYPITRKTHHMTMKRLRADHTDANK